MRRQLDLRSGRVTLLALGTLGLGGTYAGAGAAPPAAQASTGGTSSNDASAEARQTGAAVVITDSVGAAATALAPSHPLVAVPTVSATETRRNLLVGGSVSVRGAVESAGSTARTVALEERRGHRWLTVAHARTQRLGRYRLRFKPHAPGTVKLRVLVAGAGADARARRTLGSVNVYRQAFASWYGGGGPLACGGTLTSSTLGVASKTLPCGTMVRIRLGRRTVRVPVIDRGPYVAGREFDLTAATKRALGFGDVGTIWVTT
jgi:rare lipoprotein A